MRDIENAGGHAIGLRADAADADAVTAAVERAAAVFERMDVLVSNAGVAGVGGVEELAPEQIDLMIAVNVRGVIHTVRAALPHLGESGRIITNGSVNAERVPFAGAPPTP